MQLVRELPFAFNANLIIFKVIAFLAILGAFTKLRKAALSVVISVRLSVCPNGTTLLPLNGFCMTFDM